MLLGWKIANSVPYPTFLHNGKLAYLPPIGFCIELLIGSKYDL